MNSVLARNNEREADGSSYCVSLSGKMRSERKPPFLPSKHAPQKASTIFLGTTQWSFREVRASRVSCSSFVICLFGHNGKSGKKKSITATRDYSRNVILNINLIIHTRHFLFNSAFYPIDRDHSLCLGWLFLLCANFCFTVPRLILDYSVFV